MEREWKDHKDCPTEKTRELMADRWTWMKVEGGKEEKKQPNSRFRNWGLEHRTRKSLLLHQSAQVLKGIAMEGASLPLQALTSDLRIRGGRGSPGPGGACIHSRRSAGTYCTAYCGMYQGPRSGR